ncbi:MAG: hypothetical protein KBS83_00565 [Lachnospiraceae bacterium]|nr:hypothetical protein [Candidatus Equihabitans merdae]
MSDNTLNHSPIPTMKSQGAVKVKACSMLISAVRTEEGEEKLNLIMLDNRIPAGAKMY